MVVGLGANVNRFLASIPITSMDDFALMYDDDAKSIMETYNKSQARNNNVGFLTQKKLQGFLYWYCTSHNSSQKYMARGYLAIARSPTNSSKIHYTRVVTTVVLFLVS